MAGIGGIISPLAVRQLIKQVSINICALAFHSRAPRKNTRPASIVFICLYAPAATTPDANLLRNQLYSDVSVYLYTLPKSAHVFISGDMNVLLRKGDMDRLFSRNPLSRHPNAKCARDDLIDFCGTNQLSIANGRKSKHHSQRTAHGTAPMANV